MKNFNRCDPLSMYLDHYCPGCGGGPGNQPCAIARCSQQRGGMEYCYLCGEYPCAKYDGIDAYDSFITHRHQLKDVKKVREIGIDAYQAELTEKMEILKYLLANYNDGRRKSFFCLAVNLLELQDLKLVLEQTISETGSDELTLKEKAKLALSLFNTLAEKQNIVLKLNKKPKK